MFIGLLVTTITLSFVVCALVAAMFRKPIERILLRLVGDDVYTAWTKYLTFAIYVVGMSGGVQTWKLERYIEGGAGPEAAEPLQLSNAHIALELYRTVIETLQSDAWMLLVFFIFALIAYVILRGFEFRRAHDDGQRTFGDDA